MSTRKAAKLLMEDKCFLELIIGLHNNDEGFAMTDDSELPGYVRCRILQAKIFQLGGCEMPLSCLISKIDDKAMMAAINILLQEEEEK